MLNVGIGDSGSVGKYVVGPTVAEVAGLVVGIKVELEVGLGSIETKAVGILLIDGAWDSDGLKVSLMDRVVGTKVESGEVVGTKEVKLLGVGAPETFAIDVGISVGCVSTKIGDGVGSNEGLTDG